MNRLRWGVLGTANIAVKRVIPAIAAGRLGVVTAIASRDPDRAAAVAARFGIGRIHGSYQALLDDPEIDAVYIPLPNHLHVAWSVKALEAGKHVLCEKPIALDAVEARALIEARDRTGRKIMEAFMVRFHPQWRRVRELCTAGRIGDLRAIQAAFVFTVREESNVRNRVDMGGGALYDVGCYPVVIARDLFGAEPVGAVARMERNPEPGVDRITSGLLTFPGGRHLIFTCALELAPYQRVTLLGTAGRIEVPLPFSPARDQVCRLLIDSGVTLDGGSGVVEELAAADQYVLQCDQAAAVFRGDAAQEFPLEDSIANMRAIDALYRSGRSGRFETP